MFDMSISPDFFLEKVTSCPARPEDLRAFNKLIRNIHPIHSREAEVCKLKEIVAPQSPECYISAPLTTPILLHQSEIRRLLLYEHMTIWYTRDI